MQNPSTNVSPLSPIEFDALTEMANIAMGRAATSLGQLVGKEVKLTVPSVEILSDAQALKIINRIGGGSLLAVSEDFRGLFRGRVLLIFPEKNGLELVRVVVGKEAPVKDLAELEQDAIGETGNIVLNSWVSTIANLLKRNLVVSVPRVVRGSGAELFKGVALKVVLFLQIDFAISATHIAGYVALVMDLPSMNALRALIAQFIAEQR